MTAGTPISANQQMVSEAKRIRDPIKLNLGMAQCYLPKHRMTQQPSSKATHETHGHISGFWKMVRQFKPKPIEPATGKLGNAENKDRTIAQTFEHKQ